MDRKIHAFLPHFRCLTCFQCSFICSACTSLAPSIGAKSEKSRSKSQSDEPTSAIFSRSIRGQPGHLLTWPNGELLAGGVLPRPDRRTTQSYIRSGASGGTETADEADAGELADVEGGIVVEVEVGVEVGDGRPPNSGVPHAGLRHVHSSSMSN